jgi:hypothetical protein
VIFLEECKDESLIIIIFILYSTLISRAVSNQSGHSYLCPSTLSKIQSVDDCISGNFVVGYLLLSTCPPSPYLSSPHLTCPPLTLLVHPSSYLFSPHPTRPPLTLLVLPSPYLSSHHSNFLPLPYLSTPHPTCPPIILISFPYPTCQPHTLLVLPSF